MSDKNEQDANNMDQRPEEPRDEETFDQAPIDDEDTQEVGVGSDGVDDSSDESPKTVDQGAVPSEWVAEIDVDDEPELDESKLVEPDQEESELKEPGVEAPELEESELEEIDEEAIAPGTRGT
jgi:hypothetical protein